MRIGDTVYILIVVEYDDNRRIYHKDEKGHSYGGPIYREHFRAVRIKAETTRSWIVSYYDRKIPKSTLEGCYTFEQVEEKVWDHENRYKIARLVDSCSLDQLKMIAGIFDWKEQGS